MASRLAWGKRTLLSESGIVGIGVAYQGCSPGQALGKSDRTVGGEEGGLVEIEGGV